MMRALLKRGSTLAVRQVQRPVPADGEVLLRVMMAGYAGPTFMWPKAAFPRLTP
jgi:NADPH:quinone reductase-like Zn-dependent oxidoreductase